MDIDTNVAVTHKRISNQRIQRTSYSVRSSE